MRPHTGVQGHWPVLDTSRHALQHRPPTAPGAAWRLPGTLEEDATEPFWIALTIGLIVQGYKGFAAFFQTGRWNMRRFVETGGMPSAHSAAVAGLSTAVGLWHGFSNGLFAVTLYFSLIVMYDAAGLRRAAGRQAMVLNRLIERHFQQPERETQKLIELLGHTPFEVLVGGLLGTGTAFLWYKVHHP